jgi:uncharacterized protein
VKATLSLTHRCNLACTYCYCGKPRNDDMSLETARKVVDFVVDLTPRGQVIDFGFFGGEPLLRFDLLRDVAHYIGERSRETEHPVRLNVTTNGTLLNDAVVQFLDSERVYLCVSIDGPPPVHDLHRRYRDGRGSFSDVITNLRRALWQLGGVQVNAVYGPDTVGLLPETVRFFVELKVPVIHLNIDICASWTDVTGEQLQETYMAVADQYISAFESGREVGVNLIDSKIVLFLKDGYSAEDRCGMGETEWGFAPSGNIYPCERFIGEDNNSSLCLGNVHVGLDSVRRCAVLEIRGNRNEECVSCRVRQFCMNWCGCTNHYMTGRTDLAAPVLCASERAAIEAASHALTALRENELFMDHLMRYVHEGQLQHALNRKGAI